MKWREDTMINIDNEYYIKANDNCFTLEKKGAIQEEKSKNYGTM